MFRKLDVRRKSIVTFALSLDNRKIVVRYFVNRAPGQRLRETVSQLEQLTTALRTSMSCFFDLWVGELDDVPVEVGARSVVGEAEERDLGVVERGVAEIARVRRPPHGRRAAQQLFCTHDTI